MKSGDGSEMYFNDVRKGIATSFLYKCLLFTCLEMQNHMREFVGSDGYTYRNNLTLDTTNGDTAASLALASMHMNDAEILLINQWRKVLEDAKNTEEYNPLYNYGVFQIKKELDIDLVNEDGEKYPKYSSLRGNINTLKALLRSYYIEEILPGLYKYEFLK